MFCLCFSFIPLYAFLYTYFFFDKNLESYQFIYVLTDFISLPSVLFNFSYFDVTSKFLSFKLNTIFLGFDGVSLPLILLTVFIFPICYQLADFFQERHHLFINLICLEIILIFVFCILDIFYFYIFFEATLIPMFFLVGRGGARFRKIKASFYLFFYTFAGSIFMFIGLLSIFLTVGTTDFSGIFSFTFSEFQQRLL